MVGNENDGVRVYAYSTEPENGKIGVFAHEFGHVLGLPDLYDTSYQSAGVGEWCLMGGGSWGGNGSKPTQLSCWCLARLGWMTPKVVKRSSSLSLATRVTSLTDKTKPSTREFDGTSTGVVLTRISEDVKTGIVMLKVSV
jgi:M6 family metalloprotease-like protein